ncbi:MAG: helix-turn-helix transcriptional regulator [Syntrophaceae bacterium]
MEELGEKIKRLMREQNITQEELEKRTGITQSFISQIINNKKKPGYDNILKLATALRVNVGELF